MPKFKYLTDRHFLKLLDKENHKEQFIRITVLDFYSEQPLAYIEGKSTGGSCNISGTSNMRRTASCSLIVDKNGVKKVGNNNYLQYGNITEVENLISMNKKIRIETGFYNSLAILNYYPEFDIIWFPLGVYVIKAANISKNSSGLNISLTLNDKCALLNGDMGGTIPAATVFSEQESYDLNFTQRTVNKFLLKDMIKYLVVEFGGEKVENVIITDIPDTIVKVVKWNGKSTLYFYKEAYGGGYNFSLTDPSSDPAISYEQGSIKEYEYGMDVGYMNEPFVYPGTLECGAGEAVSSVLDKIKNTLGNFEWFYDVEGRFHFQQIKNYLNNSQVEDFLNVNENDFLPIMNYSKSVYTFEDAKIISSISSNPQYSNIKNDYVIWGTSKTPSGAKKPIRYHLSFKDKPRVDINKVRLCLVYKDFKGLQQVIILKENENFKYITDLNEVNSQNYYYYYYSDNSEVKGIYHYDQEQANYRSFPEWEICYLTTDDWRTELYFQGLEADNKTFSQNYFSAELNSEWPKIYNVKGEQIEKDIIGNIYKFHVYKGKYRDLKLSNYEYWLDFLSGQDGAQGIAQFNMDRIGRRTKVVSDSTSNCIFPVQIPNYVIIEADGDTSKEIEECISKEQDYIQVSSDIFKNLSVGGSQNAAYDKAKELLFTHTQYNESISISVIPVYYLEPNTRITVYDNDMGIHGDYLIKTLSLPLAPNGGSTIAATRCLEKTI